VHHGRPGRRGVGAGRQADRLREPPVED
jgi:hypothetical protein